ncbi:MAG TPA: L,D-transpeptidase [Blastocatellia bacterium]
MSESPITPEPALDAAPLKESGQWKIAASEKLHLTATAPGARSVRILYKPLAAEHRYVELKKLSSPTEGRDKFSTELRIGPDFIGDLWAEAQYPDGSTKKTNPIALANESAISAQSLDIPQENRGGSPNSDESERSDKITGGAIEQASLKEGDPRIWITVNIPAFRLTLWQSGKEVITYQIGIGRKKFPLPSGERRATAIVLNPEWVPPSSEWVLDSKDVEPGERIEADDPRNPLGKIKIILGEGILIHEASKPDDIGHLVSHGCVRMLTEDIFDLTERIIKARSLPVSHEQIERAKTTTERMAIDLNPPLWVDINYDTQVVEQGILRLYPDVYDRGSLTIENVRAELQAAGVETSSLDPQALRQMLDRVSLKEEFRVSIADIKAGRALIVGQNFPLTDRSVNKQAKKETHPSGR